MVAGFDRAAFNTVTRASCFLLPKSTSPLIAHSPLFENQVCHASSNVGARNPQFLELLKHRLSGSLNHTLAFIYFAYSMIALNGIRTQVLEVLNSLTQSDV
jgi:hypothetical protein